MTNRRGLQNTDDWKDVRALIETKRLTVIYNKLDTSITQVKAIEASLPPITTPVGILWYSLGVFSNNDEICIHDCYVMEQFRRMGIMTGMADTAIRLEESAVAVVTGRLTECSYGWADKYGFVFDVHRDIWIRPIKR